MKTHQKCWNCFKTKKLEEFYPNRTKKQAYQTRCKACNAEVMRGYMQRKRERESRVEFEK